MRPGWTLPLGLLALALARCSPVLSSSDSRASTPLSGAVLLVAPSAAPGTGAGASAAGQFPLGLSSKGCVTVGDAILYAPAGSEIADDGRHVKLARIGTYALGERLPIVQGTIQTLTASDLPAAFHRCGPGRYTVIVGPA